ncbi:Uncaracterized surface protein containing fasciclin (FAS1) repeats [Belliella buryatensis]|uniref:Uncaracterized surface protein containing fasciclin (FAS1) repeats n=2 Tax=Belliella buryatensis TaxID=1500549 RepID=A0A239CPR0_9BACT|nr:Uncaracterized surface protein containing fasciclin (FAS1) repeats [Belliella buryatensis]
MSCLILIINNSCGIFDKEEDTSHFPVDELAKFEDLSKFSEIFNSHITIDFTTGKTIFAPSDEAFENLFATYKVSTIEELHRRVGGKEYFDEVLEFHILPERKRLLEFKGARAYSIHGHELRLSYLNDTLRIIRDGFFGSSAIIQYDIPVHQGSSIIHKVHRVLRPNYASFVERDLIQEANRLGFHQFLTALTLIDDLRDTLLDLSEVTIFIPTNAAFQRLLNQYRVDSIENLVAAMGYENFKKMMLYHIIPKVVWFPERNFEYAFQTMNGFPVHIRRSIFASLIYDLKGNAVSILSIDNNFKNGYMHVIDYVLQP